MDMQRLPVQPFEVPSLFTQLRHVAVKVDQAVKDAKLALGSCDTGASANGFLNSKASAVGSGIALLRQKQEEAAILQSSMAEFLHQLRSVNDDIDSSIQTCEGLLKKDAASMDNLEKYLQKYGYQPYEEPKAEGVIKSPVKSFGPEDDKENYGGTVPPVTPAPLSACKTPLHPTLRQPFVTPAASLVKENVLRTPKLRDFASKETLDFLACESKKDAATKQAFVPRSLPFDSIDQDTMTSTTGKTLCAPEQAMSCVMSNGSSAGAMTSVGATASSCLTTWRETHNAFSPHDISTAIQPLVTPVRPACIQQLFDTTSQQPTLDPSEVVQLFMTPASDVEPGCRLRQMSDSEYCSLDAYLQRTMSKEEINTGIRLLSQHFFGSDADYSRDGALAALEGHLGHKSKCILYLLIKTGRLESQGSLVIPPATST